MTGNVFRCSGVTPATFVHARKIFLASFLLFFIKSCSALHCPHHRRLQCKEHSICDRQELFKYVPSGTLKALDSRKFCRKRSSRLSSIPEAFQCLPNNQWGLYAVIASSAAAALRLERKTSFGKNLSGPVTAMLISAILTNVGILPASGSIHLVSLQVFVLKLATPLLLFGADLKKIFLETGIMLKAFLLGTLGTLLGSLIGMLLLSGPLNSIGLPGDSWKLVSALTAKNIGGTLICFKSLISALFTLK
jgi:Protein of unknown function (DUF819)